MVSLDFFASIALFFLGLQGKTRPVSCISVSTFCEIFIWCPSTYWISIVILYPFRSRDSLKELYYKRFRGVDPEAFNDLCERFVRDRLRISVKQSFLDYLATLDRYATVIVVSASIQNYLKPWCYDMGVELISTELEVVDGKLTGRFATPNCNGPEKARRITQRYDLSTFDEIHVFGNSKGDLPMLELGTHTYYQFFE